VESGKPRELDLGSNPSIFLKHGEMEGYVLLRELQPDDRVEIKQESSDPGRETYSLVGSRPVTDSGKIRKIDLADNRVLLAMETGERRGNLDLRVPSRARLTVNGDR